MENIEQFGLPDVDNVRDLTEMQAVFVAEARRIRREKQQPDTNRGRY